MSVGGRLPCLLSWIPRILFILYLSASPLNGGDYPQLQFSPVTVDMSRGASAFIGCRFRAYTECLASPPCSCETVPDSRMNSGEVGEVLSPVQARVSEATTFVYRKQELPGCLLMCLAVLVGGILILARKKTCWAQRQVYQSSACKFLFHKFSMKAQMGASSLLPRCRTGGREDR